MFSSQDGPLDPDHAEGVDGVSRILYHVRSVQALFCTTHAHCEAVFDMLRNTLNGVFGLVPAIIRGRCHQPLNDDVELTLSCSKGLAGSCGRIPEERKHICDALTPHTLTSSPIRPSYSTSTLRTRTRPRLSSRRPSSLAISSAYATPRSPGRTRTMASQRLRRQARPAGQGGTSCCASTRKCSSSGDIST